MKVDPNQTDLYLGGIHYVRKNANEPWDFASEHITKKYDLDGNLTYQRLFDRIEVDILPTVKKKITINNDYII